MRVYHTEMTAEKKTILSDIYNPDDLRKLSLDQLPQICSELRQFIIDALSQNPGQVFDKERIYERIWGYDSEGDSSVVAEHIRRIRTKIAAYTDRVYIETVWGCGYKWLK